MTSVRLSGGMVPNVLSIAGSDPSGGAGIQGDLKTFAALGVHGCAVVSLLTAQNTRELTGVLPTPPEFVSLQLRAVFDDIEIHAVKVGALGNASVVGAVADALRAHGATNVVVDPVLCSSTGRSLLDGKGLAALRRELLPLATVVTPNAPEIGALLGTRAPGTLADVREAVRRLHADGAAHVLVTGGHVDDGDDCVDVLYDGVHVHEIRVRRVATVAAHGTGCALSSAIAAFLARGYDVLRACTEAQRFVVAAIAARSRLMVGRGAGPLHHLDALWRAGAAGAPQPMEVA